MEWKGKGWEWMRSIESRYKRKDGMGREGMVVDEKYRVKIKKGE